MLEIIRKRPFVMILISNEEKIKIHELKMLFNPRQYLKIRAQIYIG